MSEFSTLVQEYYKNPVNNYRMDDAMIFRHEGNAICGDDITVYIKYERPLVSGYYPTADLDPQYIVTALSYDGNVSMVTQAAASFFSELIIGKSFEEIVALDEKLMIENGFDVSHRRRRARVIPLLATRNAIHVFLQDNKEDTFDDLLGE